MASERFSFPHPGMLFRNSGVRVRTGSFHKIGAAAPLLFLNAEEFRAASRRFEGGFDPVIFLRENAGQNQASSGFAEGEEFLFSRQERGGQNVRSDDVVADAALIFHQGGRGKGEFSVRNAVFPRILPRDADGVRINVERVDPRASELARGDGEDAGSGARVQHGDFPGSGAAQFGDAPVDRRQAGFCRGVLSGAETHAGVQLDDDLSRRRLEMLPGGGDRQRFGNDKRFEVDFPRLGPVLFFQLCTGEVSEMYAEGLKLRVLFLKNPFCVERVFFRGK